MNPKYFFLLSIAVLAGTAIFTASAEADGCRRVVVNHHQAVTYAPAHHAYDFHHQNTLIVGKAFAVAVAPDYYLGVADEARMLAFAKQVAQEMVAIQQQQRSSASPQPAPQQQNLTTGPAPAPTPGTIPPAKSKDIKEVLTARCAGCHSGQKAPNLSGDPNLIPELVRYRCLSQCINNRMPKGKAPLDNDELNIIQAWADAGGTK